MNSQYQRLNAQGVFQIQTTVSGVNVSINISIPQVRSNTQENLNMTQPLKNLNF